MTDPPFEVFGEACQLVHTQPQRPAASNEPQSLTDCLLHTYCIPHTAETEGEGNTGTAGITSHEGDPEMGTPL